MDVALSRGDKKVWETVAHHGRATKKILKLICLERRFEHVLAIKLHGEHYITESDKLYYSIWPTTIVNQYGRHVSIETHQQNWENNKASK